MIHPLNVSRVNIQETIRLNKKIDSTYLLFVCTHMFTRHFYRSDEVVSALHWCIQKGRTQEAVFWCLELIDSEMKETVVQELYLVWLWYFGIGNLSALLSIANLDTEQDIYTVVCGLSRLPKEARDRSVLVLLYYGSQDIKQPDRASAFPCLEPVFQQMLCSPLEKAFANAVYQGKSRLAFDLSRALWQTPRRVYDLLEQIQQKKHKGTLSEVLTVLELNDATCSWGTRACAIATVCLDGKRVKHSLKPLSPSLPPELICSLEDWKQMSGRRKRRSFAIPYECLYYITKRGRLSNKETTLTDLYALSYDTLEGCPFWTRVIEEEVPWLDDDRKEAFYDLYFPDDIPDEWSKAEQEKSHGFGCLINTEVPNYKKYIDKWLRRVPTRSIWLPDRDFLNLCVEEKEWEKLFDKPWLDVVSTWCLTPVKKRVLVVADEIV